MMENTTLEDKRHPAKKTCSRHKMLLSAAYLLITGLLVLSLICSPASARLGDGTIIESGNTVYLGEKNLDFSGFTDGLVNPLAYLRDDIGGDIITLSAGIAPSLTGIKEGSYFAYDTTANKGNNYCIVKTLNLGAMSVKAYGYDTSSTENPGYISKDTPVIFYLTGTGINFYPGEFASVTGVWNEFTLTNTQTAAQINQITNIANTPQTLQNVAHPDDATNPTYAFKISRQTNAPDTNAVMQMKFTLNLTGLSETQRSVWIDFTACDDKLTLTDISINQGETGTMVLKGAAYTKYNLEIPTTYNITFQPAANLIVSSDGKTAVATPDWSRTVNLPIKVDMFVPADDDNYYVRASPADEPEKIVRGKIKVVSKDYKPAITIPSGDFVSGDYIKIKGTIPKSYNKVYVYYTSAIGDNGVNLNGTPVIDGVDSSFTVITRPAGTSPDTEYSWEKIWSTATLDAMKTYTLYANLEPYGDIESSKAGGMGRLTKSNGTTAVYLSEPTLHAKMPDNTNSIFVKGDVFYTEWLARGPLGATEFNDYGKIRWYIFGTNYHFTDYEERNVFNGAVGEKPASMNYGISYDRDFTKGLEAGTYYIVYQHPGKNNVFDINPDIETGEFGILTATDSGRTLSSATTRQTANLQYALEEFFNQARNDDLIVIDSFTIEEPWFTIDPINDVKLGDSVSVSGKTNYAAEGSPINPKYSVGNTFELTIDLAEMYLTGENTAMKMDPVRSTSSVKKGGNGQPNTFSFSNVGGDTSLWYPGTYIATVRNKETGEYKSQSFVVVVPGTVETYDSAVQTYDPALTTELTPTPTPIITQTPTPEKTKKKTAKSPGFILAPLGIATAVILWRKNNGR